MYAVHGRDSVEKLDDSAFAALELGAFVNGQKGLPISTPKHYNPYSG